MYVDILILSQLMSGPKHGYEIKKNVERILGSGFSINNNTLYPALRRFQEMGAVTKEVELQEGKPNRHIYRVTDLGAEVLEEMLREFSPEMAGDEAEFLVRVALFDMLDVDSRKQILEARKRVLNKWLEHLDQVAEPLSLAKRRPFGWRVVQFQKHLIEQELAWIRELEQESEGS
ncbi:PadR family transcriptional regulator [Effusibacillus pohliae]|uniref:PadR family transcriptional regulator n=1 Tax=Effusibacillus pohliae TaxID=232270 RepID=UPI00036F7A37|nr:PadR family transcriptional regulator [Effusibacillus pohliae]